MTDYAQLIFATGLILMGHIDSRAAALTLGYYHSMKTNRNTIMPSLMRI